MNDDLDTVEGFSSADRRRLSAPALRTFLAIADLWKLSNQQRRKVLGNPAPSTFHHWSKQARAHHDIALAGDALIRISACLGIHQALGVLFDEEHEAVAWLHSVHDGPIFHSAPPIDLIANGTREGLLQAKRFVDAACLGLYMAPGTLDADCKPYEDHEIIFH